MRDLERSWALKGWTPTPLELERLTKVISNLTSPLNIGPTRTEEFKMASLPKIGFSNRYSSVFFSSEQRASVRCHFFFFFFVQDDRSSVFHPRGTLPLHRAKNR
jgi:hypothetical protein